MLVCLVYVCMILHLIRNLFQQELSLLVAISMLQEFCKPVVRVHLALVLGLSTFDCTDLLWFSFLIYLACILLNLINKVTNVANASCALQYIGFCIAKIVPHKGHQQQKKNKTLPPFSDYSEKILVLQLQKI
jgi:hypothetical protein